MTDAPEDNWYIVKQASGQCKILSEAELATSANPETPKDTASTEAASEKWGPFKAQNQAIAKRIGLIRAGQCQPTL